MLDPDCTWCGYDVFTLQCLPGRKLCSAGPTTSLIFQPLVSPELYFSVSWSPHYPLPSYRQTWFDLPIACNILCNGQDHTILALSQPKSLYCRFWLFQIIVAKWSLASQKWYLRIQSCSLGTRPQEKSEFKQDVVWPPIIKNGKHWFCDILGQVMK